MTKEREGWEWKECGDGGFWVKVTGESHRHKLDFFCRHCERPTGTVDDPYTEKYGVCYLCYTMHIDEREKPNIDLSKYQPKSKKY